MKYIEKRIKTIINEMKNLNNLFILITLITLGSCSSYKTNGNAVYVGKQRHFEMITGKYYETYDGESRLTLKPDSSFCYIETGSRIKNIWGLGTWHDRGDYIILDFNIFIEDKEMHEMLSGMKYIDSRSMVIKKKGKKELIILPAEARLRPLYYIKKGRKKVYRVF